jgi:hypothetical protein
VASARFSARRLESRRGGALVVVLVIALVGESARGLEEPRRIATGAILDDLLGAGVVVGYVLRSSKSAGSHYEHS